MRWHPDLEALIRSGQWKPAPGAVPCAAGCGWPLDPKLTAAGMTMHPMCEADEAERDDENRPGSLAMIDAED